MHLVSKKEDEYRGTPTAEDEFDHPRGTTRKEKGPGAAGNPLAAKRAVGDSAIQAPRSIRPVLNGEQFSLSDALIEPNPHDLQLEQGAPKVNCTPHATVQEISVSWSVR